MFTEPKRAGQYRLSDSGDRSYDGAWADGTIDIAAGTVVALRTADTLIVPWDSTGSGGVQTAIGVIDGPVVGNAEVPRKRVAICAREAEVDYSELTYVGTKTITQIQTALPKLVVR